MDLSFLAFMPLLLAYAGRAGAAAESEREGGKVGGRERERCRQLLSCGSHPTVSVGFGVVSLLAVLGGNVVCVTSLLSTGARS